MDGDRTKSDGRTPYQRERFFARICALQVLYQRELQPDIEWDAHRWSYYLCMISDVLDEIEEYLPNSLKALLGELNGVWKTLKAAEKTLADLEKRQELYRVWLDMSKMTQADLDRLKEKKKTLGEAERVVLEAMSEESSRQTELFKFDEADEALLTETRHEAHMAEFKLNEKAERLLKHSCFQFTQKLVDGVLAKKELIDEQILLAAKNWRLERMGRLDLNLMRVAAFELLNRPEPPAVATPPATAINEAIELSKIFCQTDSRRFVNGVLDKLRKNNLAEKKSEENASPAEDTPQTDAPPPEEGAEG